MPIDPLHNELFKNGSLFHKTLFLDNFYNNIDIDEVSSTDLASFLVRIINSTDESSIKRSAFKILAELTIVGRISNNYTALGIAYDFLSDQNASLQVASLKYLPYFQTTLAADIIEKVKDLSGSPDGDVASQAYYFLGIRQIMHGLKENQQQQVVIELHEALRYFQASTGSAENRGDADFFISFVNWSLAVINNDSQAIMTELFNHLETELHKIAQYSLSETEFAIQYRIFQQISSIRDAIKIVSEADVWLEIKPQIELLMSLQTGRIGQLSEDPINVKILTIINDQLLRRLEEAVFSVNLINEKRRLKALKETSASEDLTKFITYLIDLYPETTDLPAENMRLLAILADYAGSETGLDLYQQILHKERTLENVLSLILVQGKGNQQPFKTGSIQGEKVLTVLMAQIDLILPGYPQDKRTTFMNVLEEVIRYARTTFVDNDKARFKFLFCESDGGKGQTAVEQDLQDNMLLFFEHSKIADGLDHEKTKFVDGGRVDILYKKDVITLPIELKKTLLRPNKAKLEENYIAQAQTYTAGYDQLGIFVLLELSDKSKDPPPNFQDWFQIHHLPPSTELEVRHPDYIISVTIPGNRTLPSSKSTYV